MKAHTIWKPLWKREFRALCGHRSLLIGLLIAFVFGIAISSLAGAPEGRLWVLYQLVYYGLPLFSLLGTIMLVRQDLREAPLLALLPSASPARVMVKTGVAVSYWSILLILLVLPSAFRGEGLRLFRLVEGGLLVVLVFSSLGVWRAFRARTEVRAYFGGLAWWLVLLISSGALAYGVHLWMRPEFTPQATLGLLMSNPLESFRIFVFFGVNAVPMNPQTNSDLALWWMEHPLTWLGIIAMGYFIPALLLAGRDLRYRAHAAGA